MFDNKPMQCLDPEHIETLVQRDFCAGKSEGAACKKPYAEPNSQAGLPATVYEEEGVCEHGYCLSAAFSTCNDGNIGASCGMKGVLDTKLRQFTGTCVERGSLYRPRCNFTDNGVIIGTATVLVAPAPRATTAAPTRVPTPTRSPLPSTNNNGALTPLFTPSPTPTPAASSAEQSASSLLALALLYTALAISSLRSSDSLANKSFALEAAIAMPCLNSYVDECARFDAVVPSEARSPSPHFKHQGESVHSLQHTTVRARAQNSGLSARHSWV